MNGGELEPRRIGGDDGLKPDLALRARIGEHNGAAGGLELLHHPGEQLGVQMPGPGKAVHRVGGERFYLRVFRHHAAHKLPWLWRAVGPVAQQGVGGGLEVAERGGDAPDAQRWTDASQAGEGELHLRATFGGEQLVPLVHHDTAQVGENRCVILAAQQQRERLRCGDQSGGEAVALTGTPRRRGIAGARLHRPRKPQRLDGLTQRLFGVGGERTQRRDPQHAQRCGIGTPAQRARRLVLGQCFEHRPHPGSVRFPGTGGGVNEP